MAQHSHLISQISRYFSRNLASVEFGKFGESQNDLAIIARIIGRRHFDRRGGTRMGRKMANFETVTQGLERSPSAQRCSAKLAQQLSIYQHIPLCAVGSPEVAVQPAKNLEPTMQARLLFDVPLSGQLGYASIPFTLTARAASDRQFAAIPRKFDLSQTY